MNWKDWFVTEPCGLEPGSTSGWDPFMRNVEQYGLETAVSDAPYKDRRWGAQETHHVDLLAILARDDFSEVRERVAVNPRVSAEILTALSRDESLSVRRWVAFHQRTPIGVLMALALDENVSVREVAIHQFRQRYG